MNLDNLLILIEIPDSWRTARKTSVTTNVFVFPNKISVGPLGGPKIEYYLTNGFKMIEGDLAQFPFAGLHYFAARKPIAKPKSFIHCAK
jgi:hypothetical protein